MSRIHRPVASGVTTMFCIIMERTSDNDMKATLLQRESKVSRDTDEPHFRPVVSVWGLPLQVARNSMARALRDNSTNPMRLSRPTSSDGEGIPLDEASGVRLGLTLIALKPLRKLDRMEQILDGIEDMSREETFYWFAKCMNGTRRRAGKALRTLLAGK